ncbi:hypothetical protein HYE82_32475 [Streptomyces sp. BR123]|uniref:hypothetical protein n=1 Tax=Streptomyces sp. BR123 TaxID=2749828 RepID=UPI0015C454D2|nr:hypothetical protein [Streptomyces sp. BR123]NXY99017.1 hypothetical protein [Streptomyces sp. BR123]
MGGCDGRNWIHGGSGPGRRSPAPRAGAAGFVPEQAHTAAGRTAILSMVEAGTGVALALQDVAALRTASPHA